MAPKSYGRTFEIDQIVSLWAGRRERHRHSLPRASRPGARLPRRGQARKPASRPRLLGLLHSVQLQIARNWQALYKKGYGVAPSWVSVEIQSIDEKDTGLRPSRL